MAPGTVSFVPGLLTLNLKLKDLRAGTLCDWGCTIYSDFSLNPTRYLMVPVHDGPESNRGRDSEVRVMVKGDQAHSTQFFSRVLREQTGGGRPGGVSQQQEKFWGLLPLTFARLFKLGCGSCYSGDSRKIIRISISKMFALGRLEDGSRLGGSFSHLLPESNWN